MKPARTVTAALAFVFAAACGNAPTIPAAPTSVHSTAAPQPPVPPPVTGQITLAATTPASGATLKLSGCPALGSGRSHATGPIWCTNELSLDFDVVVDRDITDALLVVTFIGGDGNRCAFSYSPQSALTADVPLSLTTSMVEFVGVDDDPSRPADLGCEPLPHVTNSLLVELVDLSVPRRATTVTSRNLDLTFTFAMWQ